MNSGNAMTVDDSSQTPIKLEGKYSAIIICWILGLGSLISWNSLTSIEDYYYDIFPDYHPSRVLTIVYQPFAFGTMAFLAYNESKIDTRKRNILGYIMFFVGTLALFLLDIVTSGKGSIESYVGICLIVAAFGAADALIQGGMLGDLALMCPEFIQSFLAGMAASGALTSALRLITEAVFSNIDNGLRKGALLFLSISILFEFLCIFLYAFVFTKLPIVKHYRRKAADEGSKTVSSDLSAAGIKTDLTQRLVDGEPSNLDRLSNKELLFQNFDYALDLFLIFVLTLSIFPGFLYENTGTHQLGSWYPLVLVATFNVGDLISRYIPLIPCLKLQSRKGLLIVVVSRFLLVPAFYFTAKYGDQGWMIMLVSILGLTNGYLLVCVLTAAPKGYKGPEQNALGNLLVFFLLGGIFLGAALDWLWLIGNESFLSKTITKIIEVTAL
ncbi:putative equilibrative nucleoside transporter, MFS transporter superfamily [Helianthus anomalus]